MCLNIQGDCFLFSSLTEIVAILVTESPRLKWILGDELKSNRTYPRKEKKDQSLVASHRHLTELLTLPSLATLVYWHLSPNKRNFQIVDNIRVGNADYTNGMHSITKHTLPASLWRHSHMTSDFRGNLTMGEQNRTLRHLWWTNVDLFKENIKTKVVTFLYSPST